jgi:hypothetical protein
MPIVCFVVLKTISEQERTIMTTLYLDGAKNTDRFKDGSVDVLPHFGCLELPQISSQVIQVWRIAAWKCNRHFMY